MPIVTVKITNDEIVVGVPARSVRQATMNLIAVRDNKIVAIGADAGTARVHAVGVPNSTWYLGRAIDAERINVDHTNATIRYLTARALGLAYPGWRLLLRIPAYRIQWAEWESIRREDRLAILRFLFCQRADVNGAPVIRPRIDVPIVRLLLHGTIRMD